MPVNHQLHVAAERRAPPFVIFAIHGWETISEFMVRTRLRCLVLLLRTSSGFELGPCAFKAASLSAEGVGGKGNLDICRHSDPLCFSRYAVPG